MTRINRIILIGGLGAFCVLAFTGCNSPVNPAVILVNPASDLGFEVIGSEAQNQFDWLALAGRVRAVAPEDEDLKTTKQFLGYIKVKVTFVNEAREVLVEDETYIDATKSVLLPGSEKDFLLVRPRIDNFYQYEITLEPITKVL